MVAFYLAAALYFVVGGTPPTNRVGEPIGGDYVAFHTAGRMLLAGEGGALYDAGRVRQVQRESTLGLVPKLYDPFRNPPFLALLYAPLAPLALVPSFLAWTALSAICLVVALRLAVEEVPALRPRWPGLILVVAGFCPVYLGLVGGQNATLGLLLYVLIYRAMRRGREAEAGVWAALGLFKPQLFLIFPIIFVASRRWRALAAYGLTASVLAAVSIALVGVDGARGWLRIVLSADLEGGIVANQSARMHSLKSFLDLLLPATSGLPLALTLAAGAALVVPLFRTWRSAGSWGQGIEARWAFTSIVAVLIDPHIFDYDLSVLVLSGILVGWSLSGARWWLLAFDVLAFLRAPVPVGAVYLQPTVPVLCFAAFWLWRHVGVGTPTVRVPAALPLAPLAKVRAA